MLCWLKRLILWFKSSRSATNIAVNYICLLRDIGRITLLFKILRSVGIFTISRCIICSDTSIIKKKHGSIFCFDNSYNKRDCTVIVNEHSPLILYHWPYKRPQHMKEEFEDTIWIIRNRRNQFLVWNRHKHVTRLHR